MVYKFTYTEAVLEFSQNRGRVFLEAETHAGVGDMNGDGVDDFAVGAVGMYGYGMIYVFSGTGEPTAVEDSDEPSLPDAFELHQNYPNPFNSQTVISFELSQTSSVRLSIHNVLGQEVAVLIDKPVSAGIHSVVWDGTGRRGQAVASGVYLYRLTTDVGMAEKKLVVVK